MTIVKLVEMTWLNRYLWPIEITFYQGAELIGNEFLNCFIGTQYYIKSKLASSGNLQANATI